ncbi:MAG: pyrroline-5-carboxylate reductase [Candidatus Omnitrophota bacterium]
MKKIGIIGYGNMGSAIAERLKYNYDTFVFDKDKNKTAGLLRISVCPDTLNLAEKSEILILAIKPRDFDSVLGEIKDRVKDKLIISIAAGISTAYIEKLLGKARVIRTMPNLPAKIGKGMICLCKGRYVLGNDLALTQEVFSSLGETMIVEENHMNAVTAISGSGPGLFCYVLERDNVDYNNIPEGLKINFTAYLEQTAVNDFGINPKQAIILAQATTSGTIALIKASGLSPRELKMQVASPGGTTETGLNVLEHGGTIEDAIKAAENRAEQLSKGR